MDGMPFLHYQTLLDADVFLFTLTLLRNAVTKLYCLITIVL